MKLYIRKFVKDFFKKSVKRLLSPKEKHVKSILLNFSWLLFFNSCFQHTCKKSRPRKPSGNTFRSQEMGLQTWLRGRHESGIPFLGYPSGKIFPEDFSFSSKVLHHFSLGLKWVPGKIFKFPDIKFHVVFL